MAALATALDRSNEIPDPTSGEWYALYTCARHEKRVAQQLQERQIDSFLPLYQAVHRWKDRSVRVSLPLFPGYVFVHTDLKDRVNVLQLPSAVRFVGFGDRPTPIPESEMEVLRRGLVDGVVAEPHPYLKVGDQVRIKRGLFEGMQGVLIRKKDVLRVVLSIDVIMRSVAVEVDAADVAPA